jgi:hypothetical protein
MIPRQAFFISFNDSPEETPGTQFLYQFPPKLPPGTVRCRGTIRYNMYEKKALAFHVQHPGHLARKLLIEMQAHDTGRLFEAPVASALVFRSLWDLLLKRRNQNSAGRRPEWLPHSPLEEV